MKRLEPGAGKLARRVLRGGWCSNALSLPDNCSRQREFDGSHLKLPGFSRCFELHGHQRNAIWRIVQAGNIKAELLRIATDRGVDLIVLGSRERHGLSIMFNQTEDTILHAAPCDVLAVRWKKT